MQANKIFLIFSLFACILVVLGLMFVDGNGNIVSMAYAEEGSTPIPTDIPTPIDQPFAKSSPTGPSPVEGQTWTSTGFFNIIWGDGTEGETLTTYILIDDSGQETLLLVDESMSQSIGGVLWLDRKKVNVAGVWSTSVSSTESTTGLKVSSISLAPSSETGNLIENFAPAVTGSRPWITIMCKFSDFAVEPKTLAFFSGMYSNTTPGLDHYWREVSYETANVAGSGASGWFVLPNTEAYYNPSDTLGGTNLSQLATDCIAAADASVNFSLYSGINMMFNTDFDNGYAWGGSRYMTLDGITKTWSTTWEPPWAYSDISVIQHEMGHGFGLPHSSGAYGATYDNAWDVMSKDRYNCAAATDPTYGCKAQHTISYHKDILGWIPSAQKFTVASGSWTTITLEQLALPATTNYKMAQIPIGSSSTRFYTVEARRLTGYDIKLAGAAVIIHEIDTTRQRPAYVLDPDLNGVTSDAGAMWVVGETFVDAINNISVQVDSATATGFQITIRNATASLPAPVLTVEPPITPGIENTIYWSAVTPAADIPLAVGSRRIGQSASNNLTSTGAIASQSVFGSSTHSTEIIKGPVSSANIPNPIQYTGTGGMSTHQTIVEDRSETAEATLSLESAFIPQDKDRKVLPMTVQLAATSVFSETFEGDFPGTSWLLYGSPTWDDTNYDKYGGSWSGWCGDSALNPANGYTDNMNAWMVYGPFSLAGATSANMSFWYKNLSESGWDYFAWFASVDGVNFSGYHISGDQNSWRSEILDLASVPTIGDLRGQPQVWIAFNFTSDGSNSGPTYKGAYVDDIVITKDVANNADLTPYQPSNWNDKIPIGTSQLSADADHSYTGAYYDNQTLYFNWGSLNQGSATASGYTVHVEVTGTGGGIWNWTSLTTDPSYWTHLTTDQAVGPLAAGNHTFKVWVDYSGTVSESNESNNYYERTITVSPGLVEYYAECADNAGFNSPRNSGWISQRETTFQNLTPGQTYWYRVKAKSGTNESGWSNIEHSQQDSPGSIQLNTTGYTVAESGGTTTITATRTGGSNGAVGISYATSNGTAIAGSDYTSTSGTLNWANGDTTNKTFTVSITNDSKDEANETFTVTLSSPTGGAATGNPTSATVAITDDDPTPTVQFSSASSSGSEATTPAAITVTLSASSGQTVTVNYATSNGSATAGSDYTTTNGTLTFNPGDTSKSINVPVTNDTTPEGNETFNATLSSPSNASPGTIMTHTYTINDNDTFGWQSIPGASASPPGLAYNPSANKLQMVVRAADNTIWASTFNSSGTFNNDWIKIPGLMADAPALAWNTLTNKLHMVARASDSTLWASTFNSVGTFNNDWAPISGLADSPPALTWNPLNSKLYLVVRASDSSMWTATFNSTGVFNNDWVNVPGRTASPPALMWNPVANEIQMVVRASDDTMWGSTFSSSGVFNNDWVNIPGRTISPSAIVWDGFESKIAMMVRAFDNTMWYSTFSSAGIFNNDWINFPGLTASTPAMAYLPSIGYLEIVVRAEDNSMWAILY